MNPSLLVTSNRLRTLALVFCFPGLLLGLSCSFGPADLDLRVSGPLLQEAYVWQRAWTPAVATAVRATGEAEVDGDLGGLVLLAAEVSERPGGRLEVHRVAYDAEALPSRRAGLAVRVNPLSRELEEVGDQLAELAVEEVRRARAVGIEVTELQLDYDCPTRLLAEYARFVEGVERRLAEDSDGADPPPVTWTALPDWMTSEDFPLLLATLGHSSGTRPGYVLQVHSLELPEPGKPAPLVDDRAARRAVERAARYGHSFRVALPTYGYEARFTAEGDLLGLAAEGAPPRSAGIGARTAHVTSDALALAELVASWRRERPAELVGVAWFRLPTGADARAWSPDAFRAVRAGRMEELHRPVIARARSGEPGLVEIDLIAPAAGGSAPAAVEIAWRDARLVAADGVGGFRAPISSASHRARIEERGSGVGEPLRPHERRTVAWLRFDGPIDPREVRLEIVD